MRSRVNMFIYMLYTNVLCWLILYLYILNCGPGSSVGIATDYWLDGPGIESQNRKKLVKEREILNTV
jgi:hypothetical protein